MGNGTKEIKTADSLVRPVAVYYHNLSQSGGAERMASALASELSCRGRPIHLVSWNSKEESPFYKLNPRFLFPHSAQIKDGSGKSENPEIMAILAGQSNSHFNWVCDVRR